MSISPFKRQWVTHIRNAHPRPDRPEGELQIVLVSVEDGCDVCARFDILAELDWEYDTSEACGND